MRTYPAHRYIDFMLALGMSDAEVNHMLARDGIPILEPADLSRARYQLDLPAGFDRSDPSQEPWATWVSVVLAALAFAAYHPLRGATGAIEWPVFASLFVAGLYFGGLYVVRGFGIAVAAHASYDIVVAAVSQPAG